MKKFLRRKSDEPTDEQIQKKQEQMVELIKQAQKREQRHRQKREQRQRQEQKQEQRQKQQRQKQKQHLDQIPAIEITQEEYTHLYGERCKRILKINNKEICRVDNRNTKNDSITQANTFLILELTKKVDRLQDQNHRLEGLLKEFLDRIEFVPGSTEYNAAQEHFESTLGVSSACKDELCQAD